MKKTLIPFISLFAAISTSYGYGTQNPFFGDTENHFAIYTGTGFDQGFIVPPPLKPVPFYIGQIQYSMPTTFFHVPARQSLNFAQTLGTRKKYGWDWQDFTIPMIFVSEDIALFAGDDWFVGTGAGVGLQAHQNDRIGSKLIFQFKMSAGYRFCGHMGAEVYLQHFSNANTAPDNHSYAFYGLGLFYNF